VGASEADARVDADAAVAACAAVAAIGARVGIRQGRARKAGDPSSSGMVSVRDRGLDAVGRPPDVPTRRS